jgi:hypothetical protein
MIDLLLGSESVLQQIPGLRRLSTKLESLTLCFKEYAGHFLSVVTYL